MNWTWFSSWLLFSLSFPLLPRFCFCFCFQDQLSFLDSSLFVLFLNYDWLLPTLPLPSDLSKTTTLLISILSEQFLVLLFHGVSETTDLTDRSLVPLLKFCTLLASGQTLLSCLPIVFLLSLFVASPSSPEE